MRKIPLTALALILAGPATADVASVVQDHILSGHARFAQSAGSLRDISEKTCDASILQPEFHATYDAWMAISHLHFGPAETQGRGLAIAFWPDPKGLGQKAQLRLLTGDPAALTPSAFAQQSVAARGLAGLERLLYPAETLPADPCPLIRATATNLADMADALATDWGPFAELLLHPGAEGNIRYLTEDEVKQALFTQLGAGLEFIADQRLGRPLGTFDKPRPERAEARASARSLRNVALELAALRQMAGLLVTAPRTDAAFARAEALAADLDDPTLAGVAEPAGRLKVEILQQAVRAIHATAVQEMGAALGVDMGFNSQDGD